MLKQLVISLVLVALISIITFAQENPETEKNTNTKMHNMNHKNHTHNSQYISEFNNEIKSLTNEELNHLLNGEGMGLAKAGELNSYPGPDMFLIFPLNLN